jgi:dipeptidyl aminopeptidase/acylaminoacyl peptidase
MAKKVKPYGSWKSPITTDLITSETIKLGGIVIDGQDVYWRESRPREKGRNVIVHHKSNGQTVDVIPPSFNARTRVHEYGGGEFLVIDGTVYFSNFADQRLYCANGNPPHPITPKTAMRYADGIFDRSRQRIICVCEDHTNTEREPINTIIGLDLDNKSAGIAPRRVLVSGHDFYASPRISPDGKHLAWLAWNHPNMPWDGSELWIGELLSNGLLGCAECVAGGSEEGIFRPTWSPDGTLYFVSDQNGWWNLYRSSDGEKVEPVIEMEAEFGLPQWVFGLSTYAFESAQRIICTYFQQGTWHLNSLDIETKRLDPIEVPYTTISEIRTAPGQVVFQGGSPTESTSIVRLDLATGELETLRRTSQAKIDKKYLSLPRPIEYPTENDLTAHAFFYPPKNDDYDTPTDELAPLLVISHGGPTGMTDNTLDLTTQYWTSRGIAVLDVNYGGSTGYGREYRQRLQGQWGVVDVDDCVNGALHLAKSGAVDRNRLIIRGGSAGGYTTLCALTFRDIFKAGASYYGVGDLEALAKETHKFESRYLDRLIGPYPERRDLYVARSPINFADKLNCPVIFFQGLEDQVVPPVQTEMMVDALCKKKVPVAYVPFEGEQHGFRRAENIKRALDAELYFYSRIFGFPLAEPVKPVTIKNL